MAKDERQLQKHQASEVVGVIRRSSLDPSDFAFTEVDASSVVVSRLIYRPDHRYTFAFFPGHRTEWAVTYSPGEQKGTVVEEVANWTAALQRVRLWLTFIEREQKSTHTPLEVHGGASSSNVADPPIVQRADDIRNDAYLRNETGLFGMATPKPSVGGVPLVGKPAVQPKPLPTRVQQTIRPAVQPKPAARPERAVPPKPSDPAPAGATREVTVHVGTRPRVFIVHGHDPGKLDSVARFVERLDFEAVIFSEGVSRGRTIIQKFNDLGGKADYAIVLMTPDDIGQKVGETPQPRARQNVIMELGWFLGRMGGEKVTALVVGTMEKPSDIDGRLYTSWDDYGGWKTDIASEMRAAGLPVDMNKLAKR